MFKKIISLALLFVMAFSLSGCFESGYYKAIEYDSLEEVQALVPFLYYFDFNAESFTLSNFETWVERKTRGSKVVETIHLGYRLKCEFEIDGKNYYYGVTSGNVYTLEPIDGEASYSSSTIAGPFVGEFIIDEIKFIIYGDTVAYFCIEGYTYKFRTNREINEEFTLEDFKLELEPIILGRCKVA